MIKDSKLFILLLILSFNISSKAYGLTYDMLLPDHIAKAEITCFELLEQDEVSAINRIETTKGEVKYQVVSVVIIEVLPSVVQLACNYTVRNSIFCKYVKYAGQALIGIYKDDIEEAIKKWTTKKAGSIGVAKVYASSRIEASDAQKSFKLSKEKAGYPWSAPVVETHRNMNFRN